MTQVAGRPGVDSGLCAVPCGPKLALPPKPGPRRTAPAALVVALALTVRAATCPSWHRQGHDLTCTKAHVSMPPTPRCPGTPRSERQKPSISGGARPPSELRRTALRDKSSAGSRAGPLARALCLWRSALALLQFCSAQVVLRFCAPLCSARHNVTQRELPGQLARRSAAPTATGTCKPPPYAGRGVSQPTVPAGMPWDSMRSELNPRS